MITLQGETMISFDKCLSIMSAGLLAWPAIALAAPNMQEGEWENAVEMKMEIPGMPFALPAMKFKSTNCLTQKDMVPNTAKKDQRCEIKKQEVSGNKVTWQTLCTDKDGTTEGEGEVTYSGNSYQGVMHARMIPKDKSAQATKVDYKLNGRYLGACKK